MTNPDHMMVWRKPGGCAAGAAGGERESDIPANLHKNTLKMRVVVTMNRNTGESYLYIWPR